MGSVPSAFAFLLMIVAGWVNRHQLIVIEWRAWRHKSSWINFLRDRQCDEKQGYLINRPVPAEEFAQLLMAKRTVTG